nr:GntR family transcriptional regulator [Puniceibacterium antarcticum]
MGARMMPKRALSDRLNVPRSLVREALILLEIEGAVEVRKGSGIYICANAFMPNMIRRDDIGPFELLQARQVLEADIANLQPARLPMLIFSACARHLRWSAPILHLAAATIRVTAFFIALSRRRRRIPS